MFKFYVNGFVKLFVGKVCYGFMMCEDGMLYDDGIVVCFVEDYYVVIMMIVNVVLVYCNMDFVC